MTADGAGHEIGEIPLEMRSCCYQHSFHHISRPLPSNGEAKQAGIQSGCRLIGWGREGGSRHGLVGRKGLAFRGVCLAGSVAATEF